MANRQVRLDPDVVAWAEECAYDWDCSLSSATNRLLRALRDHPRVDDPAVPAVPASPPIVPVAVAADPGGTAETPAAAAAAASSGAARPRPGKGNPRLAHILARNRGQ